MWSDAKTSLRAMIAVSPPRRCLTKFTPRLPGRSCRRSRQARISQAGIYGARFRNRTVRLAGGALRVIRRVQEVLVDMPERFQGDDSTSTVGFAAGMSSQ